MNEERRNNPRRQFGYYMRVMDSSTGELMGYLSDICPNGIRMDTLKSLSVNKSYNLHLDLTPEVSDRPFITFSVRVKWSRPDNVAMESFIAGCEVIAISSHDEKVFNNILEKYGKPEQIW